MACKAGETLEQVQEQDQRNAVVFLEFHHEGCPLWSIECRMASVRKSYHKTYQACKSISLKHIKNQNIRFFALTCTFRRLPFPTSLALLRPGLTVNINVEVDLAIGCLSTCRYQGYHAVLCTYLHEVCCLAVKQNTKDLVISLFVILRCNCFAIWFYHSQGPRLLCSATSLWLSSVVSESSNSKTQRSNVGNLGWFFCNAWQKIK